MFSIQTGLSGRAAKAQASYLAREREKMLRDRQRAELGRLRGLIAAAKRRRRDAYHAAVRLCRRARLQLREQVRAFRARERERINLEVANLRLAARTRCATRKELIRLKGKDARKGAEARLRAERQLQAQLRRLEGHAQRKRAQLSTARERRQEDDEAVRNNLPGELRSVWDKVKRGIRPGPRTTRTEAFLEWAEANPGEVLALQSQNVDREVAALVAEYERQGAAQAARVSPSERRSLERLGLAKTRAEARQRARASGVDYVPF
jgi:hypothetical protein